MTSKILKYKQEEFILLIDEEDNWVLPYGLGLWKDSRRDIPYVVFQNSKRNAPYIGKKLSRVLMNCPSDKVVDHINNNPMDNRKTNLRITTQNCNNMNAKKRKFCKSKFKGVCPTYKKQNLWTAQIQKDYKKYTIGTSFSTEEEAAKAYDSKALELFGEFAKLNFK